MSEAAEELEQDTAIQQQLEHTENMKRLYAVPDLSEKLRAAMKELATTKAGKMDFRGTLYATVALRIEMLRKHLCADVSVVTDIITLTDEAVVMKATIMAHGEVLATGYAEEHRSGKGVNSTSALENCETSAVGRALAALGLGGGEYASADELSGAVSQQPVPNPDPRSSRPVGKEKRDEIEALIRDTDSDMDKFCGWLGIEGLSQLTEQQYQRGLKQLQGKKARQKKEADNDPA